MCTRFLNNGFNTRMRARPRALSRVLQEEPLYRGPTKRPPLARAELRRASAAAHCTVGHARWNVPAAFHRRHAAVPDVTP